MEPGASPPNGASWLATRRGFLRLAGSTTALAALAQLRVLPPRALGAGSGPATFDPGEREILTQIVDRMVYTGEPGAPPARETGAIDTIDALVGGLDPGVGTQLRLALQLFEYAPFVFDLTFSRFTRMTDAQKDISIEAWMTSRLGIRRQVFLALRNLALLGYYSQPETWTLVGYRGPLLGASGRR